MVVWFYNIGLPAIKLLLPGKWVGKLRLTPEQLLAVIHAQELAEWSLQVAARFQLPRLKKGPCGRLMIYEDAVNLSPAAIWRRIP